MPPKLDRTNEFREAIASTSKAAGQTPTRPSSSQSQKKKDEWIQTAELTAQSLHSLSVFLRGIRRAYLDVGSHNSASTASSSSRKGGGTGFGSARALDFSRGLLGVDTAEWRWMSDRERDEVDLQVKSMLKVTLSKIKQLEQAEHTRQTKTRSLWSSSGAQSAASAALSAHRQSIVLFLNNLLASVGNQQSSQQESRFQRNLDRRQQSSTGSSSAAAAAAAAVASSSSSAASSAHHAKDLKPVISDDPPIDTLLSEQQMQQFDDEARQLTEAAQSQLSQIKSAETSLLEISALQSELVIHLTQQAELTSKLWEDSMYVSGKVSDANQQLEKARDRNRESRVWLLVFLIGASFTLLFLDQY